MAGDRWQASDGAQVLEGPMLDTWREKAENARENDFHFEFQFLDLKVGVVECPTWGLDTVISTLTYVSQPNIFYVCTKPVWHIVASS